MIINRSLWLRKYNRPIVLLTILTMVTNFIFFGDNSVGIGFLISHLLTIFFFLYCLSQFYQKTKLYSTIKFEKNLFRVGLVLRIISILFFYSLYYIQTGTEFDPTAVDALWYHDTGVQIAQQFSELRFNKEELDRIDFDDLGYNLYLGVVYFIFGPNVIIARIIQGIFGSLSSILIYRIGKSLFNENVGRTAAALFLFFPMLIYFTALHFKETLMVYFTLLNIYAVINFQIKKNKVKYLALFLLTIFITFSFRAVLTYTLLASFFLSLLFTKKIKLHQKIAFTISSVFVLLIFVWQVGILDEFSGKLIKYFDRSTEGAIMANTAERMANSGQTFAKFASGPVMLVQSVSFPYPSMVKTNIRLFDVADQWYYIGSLFLWSFLSYWAILGIYDSIKTRIKQNLPLLIFTVFFSIILVITLYITSIRFNVLKMVPMLIFVAVGLDNNTSKRLKYWYPYMIWMCIVILIWNYAKVAGRGMI